MKTSPSALPVAPFIGFFFVFIYSLVFYGIQNIINISLGNLHSLTKRAKKVTNAFSVVLFSVSLFALLLLLASLDNINVLIYFVKLSH